MHVGKGYIPVTLKLAEIFFPVIDFIQALLKILEKEYRDTTLPGFSDMNWWHASLQAVFSGAKQPLSSS